MLGKLVHTPEGVRDIYGRECRKKHFVAKQLIQVLESFGYEAIETPGFEFYDIFRKERGTVSDREMYRFFDRDGNTLVFRPDFTPSIARCAAKYYKDEMLPLRLHYYGNTYVNNTGFQGKPKENTQIGAELIQDDSVQADAEMVVLMIECLLSSGLTDFQVEIGNADFFRGMAEEAGFTEEETEELKSLIEEKYSFGVEAFLLGRELSEPLKCTFMRLPQAFGNLSQLKDFGEPVHNSRSAAAIARLYDLNRRIEAYGYGAYVTYDLGMIGKLNYYTGIIFRAYTYGTGEAIASGGRYDNLVGQFGKRAAAIGMAVLLDRLMPALERQHAKIPFTGRGVLIAYEPSQEEAAVKLAVEHRKMGTEAVLISGSDLKSEQMIRYAGERLFERIIILKGEAGKTEIKLLSEEEDGGTAKALLELQNLEREGCQ